ncbi:maleylpyruvate isomerase family mycothiol-dependent enzyme [Nocardioides zeae]|uniref:Maleylpyruvate isomerase family mycothiol-dependent enzyme n=1 Tax=Nocardioides imazamoxiresistens TaxID=3231893 RepID=A0ABU3PZP4_9ACTN|nr:maleylpyruvate isomerase family mycothiol-dependent enzyme [Nocardioides zeae]MDT9594225.1 maleylpyruvate isomerase family mycothiol-dependent enzyme [Nocardioides zeae]
MAGDPQAAQAWRETYERVRSLVEETDRDDPGALDRPVPATPDWSARDLLAHMIGVDRDTLADDVDDELGEAWTQKHVDERSGRSAADLLAEWRDLADDLERFVATQDPAPLGDAVIHEQDLRGALGVPGGRESAGLAAIRDQMAEGLGERLAGRGPVRLQASDTDWVWQSGDGEPAVVLQASAYDLARALTTRRTAEQLRGYTVDGDVDPFLDDFAGLGPLPTEALPE